MMLILKERHDFLVVSKHTLALVLNPLLGISALESVVHFSCFVDGKCVLLSDLSLLLSDLSLDGAFHVNVAMR